MTLTSKPAWKRPESPAKERADVPRPLGNALRFLLPSRAVAYRESRWFAVVLIAVAVLGVVLLNLVVFRSAERRHLKQRREELSVTTDRKREQVRDVLWQYERQARFVAEQPALHELVERMIQGNPAPGDRAGLHNELDRATRTFSFLGVELVGPDGGVMDRAPTRRLPDEVGALELARSAAQARRAQMGDVPRASGDTPGLALALPLVSLGRGANSPVIVFHAGLEEGLLPLLMSWPGFGESAGAYVVRRYEGGVAYLTTPPGFMGSVSDPEGHATGRAAAMAADGVEGEAELHGPDGHRIFVVTRFLPELGWGLVGQVDRSDLMKGMRATLYGLLVLDLAMALLALGGLWFWRRTYASGLARREMEVTRRHADRVQAVFDTAFDVIITFGLDGRVQTANRAAERMFGLSASVMENQPIDRFLRGIELDHAGASPESGGGAVRLSEAHRAGGATLPVEFSLGCVGAGGERLYTAIVRDVSERIEADQRIRAFAEGLEATNRRLEEVNAQLEESSRLKSEFLANTSHELRTPLNGMIGFLQLVLDGMCDTPEEEREFLTQALECSRHLLGLINDVLDIAKIEAGKLAIEVGRVQVESLFEEVYTVTHVQAEQRGLELAFVPPEDDTHAVRGDFGKIKQILINLIGNSIKFTQRGSITVRAVAHPQLGHFMFEVVDTGIGIPLDRQKVIFDKFTQGDGSTTRKFGGTGLGLAISRSLVELMGGIIGVHSEGDEQGTRMYFSLPMWRDQHEEGPAEDESDGSRIQGPAGGPLVLLVEDDATFRHYLRSLLHHHGYRTAEARHAEGGWMLARRLRPAIVILDYALSCAEGAGIRTGWDLAEHLTNDPATRQIPVIFLTGFDEELRQKLRATAFARCPAHMTKPIEGSALLGRIEELLGSIPDRTVRVLMADDDPAVAAYVRKVLPPTRFHIEVANDGEECLHVMRTQPHGFDLLLLDLMMPETSGYDVLREMTLSGTGAQLPVLVLTNFPEGQSAEQQRLLEHGLVVDVLSKLTVHQNPRLLAKTIEAHLGAGTDDLDGNGPSVPQPTTDQAGEKAA